MVSCAPPLRTALQQCHHARSLPLKSLAQPISQAFRVRSYATHTSLPPDPIPPRDDPPSFTSTSSPTDSTSSVLASIPEEQAPSRRPVDQSQPSPASLQTATITRVGTMESTVVLTRNHQVYDSFLRKYYTRPLRMKAHTFFPEGYLREGDIVEYGVYTQSERDSKSLRNQERVEREIERLRELDRKTDEAVRQGSTKGGKMGRKGKTPRTSGDEGKEKGKTMANTGMVLEGKMVGIKGTEKEGKALRKFRREEKERVVRKGLKMRGVRFVVRRVVTPFGVGIEERGEVSNIEIPGARDGGQDSILAGLEGNISRGSGRASIAG